MAIQMIYMPRQIKDADEFRKLAEFATLCKVVRREESVKLKLRTSKILYTYITTESEAEELLKGLKIEAVEF
jgi:hypothetical protein|tara:strand:+ start:869 stop:1084 length:216 start_codon:yes stop_codon:yes gene_type:complete